MESIEQVGAADKALSPVPDEFVEERRLIGGVVVPSPDGRDPCRHWFVPEEAVA